MAVASPSLRFLLRVRQPVRGRYRRGPAPRQGVGRAASPFAGFGRGGGRTLRARPLPAPGSRPALGERPSARQAPPLGPCRLRAAPPGPARTTRRCSRRQPPPPAIPPPRRPSGQRRGQRGATRSATSPRGSAGGTPAEALLCTWIVSVTQPCGWRADL